MSDDTEHLIRQAARELQIEASISLESEKNGRWLVAFKRKDGSEALVGITGTPFYADVFSVMSAEHKSEAAATRNKADRIAKLYAELKELKGE